MQLLHARQEPRPKLPTSCVIQPAASILLQLHYPCVCVEACWEGSRSKVSILIGCSVGVAGGAVDLHDVLTCPQAVEVASHFPLVG